MNQILVTDKVIVTKEMRKKKKFYKRNFFLSIFLIIILCSYYVYAEYDRNRHEQQSQSILQNLNISNDDTTTMESEIFVATNSIIIEDDILKVFLGNDSEDEEEVKLGNILKDVQQAVEEDEALTEEGISDEYVAEDGTTYMAEAILKIPSLNIEYPVLSETSEELLKISINKLWGPNPNEVGNYVVVGHNYKSGKMFGKLKNINYGDTIELTDLSGRTITYVVSEIYVIDPTDVSCTSQLTNGKKQITLITCSNSGSKRLVVQGYEQE